MRGRRTHPGEMLRRLDHTLSTSGAGCVGEHAKNIARGGGLEKAKYHHSLLGESLGTK
jgi:hypothetical protein